MTNRNACGSVRTERAKRDFGGRKREGRGRKATVYQRSRKGTQERESVRKRGKIGQK